MAGSAVVGNLRAILTVSTAEYEAAFKKAGDVTETLVSELTKAGSSFADAGGKLSNVTRLVKDFNGVLEKRRAEEYAVAVAAIGDASKLTEADQARVNKVMKEALEHYNDLSKAPAHIVALEQATRKLEQPTTLAAKASELLGGQVVKLAAAFSVASLIDRGVASLIAFGSAAIDNAGKLVDLANKTGLGTEALQVYGQIAKETGGTLEGVADAVFKLGVNIERGSRATAGSLRELGLSLEGLRGLKPEAQFEQIAAKLHDMTDAQERNRIGVDLFGKKWAEIAPAVVEGIDSIKSHTTIASDESVRALDRASDAWDRFKDNLSRGLTQQLGKMVLDMQQFGTGVGNLFSDIASMAKGAFGGGAMGAAIAHDEFMASLKAKAQAAAVAMQDQAKGTAAAAASLIDYVAQLKAVEQELGRLTPAERAQIDAALKMGETQENLEHRYHLSEGALKLYTAATKDAGKATKDATKEWENFLDKVDVQRPMDQLQARFERLIKSGKATETALMGVAREANDLRVKGAALDPSMLALVLRFNGLSTVVPKVGEGISDFVSRLPNLRDNLFTSAEELLFFGKVFTEKLPDFSKLGEKIKPWTPEDIQRLLQSDTWRAELDGIGGLFGVLGQAATGGSQVIIRGFDQAIRATAAFVVAQEGSAAAVSAAWGVATLGITTAIQMWAHADAQNQRVLATLERIKELGGKPDQFFGGGLVHGARGFERQLATLEDTASRTGKALEAIPSATDKIVSALTSKLVGPTKQLADFKAQAEGLAKQRQQLIDTGGAQADIDALTQKINELNVAMATLTRDTVVSTQGEFDRLGRIALASFNALIKSGKSLPEAISAIGPSIDRLKTAAETFGFAGSAAFDQLSRFRDLVTANQPVLDQLAGLNELMSALGALEALDADTFTDLQAQGQAAFKALTDAGFTQHQALEQMAPLLQAVIKAHEDSGLAIDEETQKLIDQAKQEGILKADQLSTQDVLMEGLGAIIKLLGGELPAAWKKFADAGKTAAEEVRIQAEHAARGAKDAFSGLSVTIPVGFNVEEFKAGGINPGAWSMPQLPGFAHGTDGPRNFRDGTPVMLHGWETVTPYNGDFSGSGQAIQLKGDVFIDAVKTGEVILRNAPMAYRRMGGKP